MQSKLLTKWKQEKAHSLNTEAYTRPHLTARFNIQYDNFFCYRKCRLSTQFEESKATMAAGRPGGISMLDLSFIFLRKNAILGTVCLWRDREITPAIYYRSCLLICWIIGHFGQDEHLSNSSPLSNNVVLLFPFYQSNSTPNYLRVLIWLITAGEIKKKLSICLRY